MEHETPAANASLNEPHRSYLVLYNIMKEANFGFLQRTAAAFGVTEVIIVGKRSFSVGGACGMEKKVRKRHFHRLTDAIAYLRELDVAICGVEITKSAQPIHEQPFTRSTAFMVGNEGTGLTEAQHASCDFHVYIPQYGPAKCINVNVATGIVLHHFALWAGFPPATIGDGKFEAASSS